MRHDHDEIPFVECDLCGHHELADELFNGLCASCACDRAKEENLSFAKEEFNKAVDSIFALDTFSLSTQRMMKAFVIGAMQSLLTRIGSEDDLWRITNLITEQLAKEVSNAKTDGE